MASDEFPKWDYKEFPKTLPLDDLWGQVRRTVFGKPVPQEQIQIIMHSIVIGLELKSDESLLDIGCGNGALAAPLFPLCDSYLGVDSSEYLVSVANSRFASPRHIFICKDANDYVEHEDCPLRFCKALCYGMFAYLSVPSAGQLLATLHSRFRNISSMFIGSIPDRDRATHFFGENAVVRADLDNPRSQIGVWWSHDQMDKIATDAGWRVRFPRMSSDFYQSHYRYNAILES